MATLTQIDGTQRIVMGWYGSCDDDDCASFPLETQAVADVIEQVYEIHEDSTKPNIFLSWLYENQPSLTQSLTSLRCGHSYYIELKKHTTGDDIKSILIPELVIADASTAQERYVTTDDQCGGGGGGVADISFLNDSPSDNDDLRISIGANLTEINSLCTSNDWAYRIEKLAEQNADSGVVVQSKTFVSGNSNAVTTLSNYLSSVSGGDSWYKVYIQGYASDHTTSVTSEVSTTVFIAWPKPVLTINGNACADFTVDSADAETLVLPVDSCSVKNISYLEFEGPSDSGEYSTAVGPAVFNLSKYQISSLNLLAKASLSEMWEYSTDGVTYQDMSAFVNINDVSTLHIRLKAMATGSVYITPGVYQSKILFVFAGKEDNPTTYVSYVEVNAEVKDRTIQITNAADNDDLGISLSVDMVNVEKWHHRVLGPNGVELYKSTSPSGSTTITTYVPMSQQGPGTYKVEVWGVSFIDDVWKTVTPVDSEDVPMNWPPPVLDPESTTNEGYEEESGPSAGNDLLTITHNWVTEYKISMPDNGDDAWEIKRDGTDVWNTVPTSPTSYFTEASQVTNYPNTSDKYILRLKAGLPANGNNGYDRVFLVNGTAKDGSTISQKSTTVEGQVSVKPPCCDGFPGGNTFQTTGYGNNNMTPTVRARGIKVRTIGFENDGKLCFSNGILGSLPDVYLVDLFDESGSKLVGGDGATEPFGSVNVQGTFTGSKDVVYEDPNGNCYLGELSLKSPARNQLHDPGRNEGPTLFGTE